MLLADYIHSQVRIENFNSGQGGRILVLRCRSLMATDFSRKLISTWTVWKNFMRLWTILKQLIFEFTVNSFYMYLGWSVFFWLWLTQVCVTSSLVPKLSNLESKQSFHLIASLCTSDMDSDSVVTENQCLAGDHLLYSCDLNVWFRGDIVGRN